MPSPADGPRVAVVLAGGRSTRFGSDKLAADLAGASVLETTLAGLPVEVDVIVVGPERRLDHPHHHPHHHQRRRPVRFVRERPPGGGPAAALVTGLAAASAGGTGVVWVLPGDAPGAGPAAVDLDARLHAEPAAEAVVAVDAEDRLQPLQLALRPGAVRQLLANAGPDGGRDASARRLVLTLAPAAVRHRIDAAGHADIDTPEQLLRWRAMYLRNGEGT
jgi:molybdenum cofactor guanylyltransferase